MIISQKNRNGEVSVLAAGRISSEIRYLAGNEYKASRTNFTLNYNATKQQDGTIKRDNILCVCFSGIADYARRFTRNDIVIIAGRLGKQGEYWGSEKYEEPLQIIYCEYVSKQRKGRLPPNGAKGKRNYSHQYEDYEDDDLSDDIPF